ncbi:MAG: hypothetical protein MUP68_12685, partial [Deltaproteobacteria bacterium]|nr:hypothetical protein [Deltaproteobacteria bacterium]
GVNMIVTSTPKMVYTIPYSEGQAFTIHDLEFDTIPITAISSAGTKYIRWIKVGMPKIPEKSIETAFYLYKSEDDAQNGVGIGGTGFFVGVHSEKHPRHLYIYGVTNWHVAISGGFSVIRINKTDGGTDVFNYDPCEWDFIPNGGDIAICCYHRFNSTPLLPM